MNTIIKPTVGRKVWYRPVGDSVRRHFALIDQAQPCDATITYVWNDRMVNLAVVGHTGIPCALGSVQLLQPGDPVPPLVSGGYAEWMPFQVGQANKDSQPKADDSDEDIEALARICHEVNRAYCTALGDLSQAQWEYAPEWQRKSAMTGVKLHLSNPLASPAASHESWMAEKVADGWTYGAAKDPARKTHPCLVPFEQLPVEQKAKDHIFRAIVHAVVQTV